MPISVTEQIKKLADAAIEELTRAATMYYEEAGHLREQMKLAESNARKCKDKIDSLWALAEKPGLPDHRL